MSWLDENPNDEVYHIFVSDRKGIDVKDSRTYKKVTSMAFSSQRCHATLAVPFEWCYFRVARGTRTSSEFEATVKLDLSFNLANLNIRQLGKHAFEASVLREADTYRLYTYRSDGTAFYEDIWIKGQQEALIKVPDERDALFWLLPLREGVEVDNRVMLQFR